MTARASRIAAALLLALGAAVGTASHRPVEAGGGMLPDLAMAPLRDLRIEVVNGRRLLRFTAMFVNVGQGHFEVRGSRASIADPMTMSQVIYETTSRSSPIAQQFATNAVASYAGDGHNHWHVNDMTRYDMWGPGGILRGSKIGLCFQDSDPWNLSLPGQVGSFYRFLMCGTSGAELSNRMGVSVGWGDEYEYYLAWQWVDITGLPGGTYTVRAKVDPYGYFTESDETNQCTWARVSFDGSSTALTVHQQASTCSNDYEGSIFAADISWAFTTGISVGCAPDLFCTESPVTREQMASFLTRALDLPPTDADFFTDDEASIHEPDINRVAAAGIAAGCASGGFCPVDVVSREQMASFLARALGLAPTDADAFTDDEASIHESDINRIATAAIASGCSGGRYCPLDPVTRGQMAAFLHRAFGG